MLQLLPESRKTILADMMNKKWQGWRWIAAVAGFAGGFAFSTFIGCGFS